jgi:hypothetical protein
MTIAGEIMLTINIGQKIYKAGRAAKAAYDWYVEPTNNRLMREAGEQFESMRQVATIVYLTKREAEAKDQEAFRASVRAMLDDHQFARLQGSLKFEAARESTDERLEMLAYAGAGLADPDVPINEKARIERTIRQLDGEDVLFLHELRQFNDPGFVYKPEDSQSEEKQRSWHNAQKRLLHAQRKPMSRVALTVAGCVSEDAGMYGGPILAINQLADRVLATMSLYIQDKRNAETSEG